MLVASSDDWAGTIDGKESGKQISYGLGQSAVFAFKDQRPATFDTFAMLITGTEMNNVKEFELLQGNESPTGAFPVDWKISDPECEALRKTLSGIQILSGDREISEGQNSFHIRLTAPLGFSVAAIRRVASQATEGDDKPGRDRGDSRRYQSARPRKRRACARCLL